MRFSDKDNNVSISTSASTFDYVGWERGSIIQGLNTERQKSNEFNIQDMTAHLNDCLKTVGNKYGNEKLYKSSIEVFGKTQNALIEAVDKTIG
jgi:hypothetical protein